jgi:hypothetical protein
MGWLIVDELGIGNKLIRLCPRGVEKLKQTDGDDGEPTRSSSPGLGAPSRQYDIRHAQNRAYDILLDMIVILRALIEPFQAWDQMNAISTLHTMQYSIIKSPRNFAAACTPGPVAEVARCSE